MNELSIADIPINNLSLSYLTDKKIGASVLRLDGIHPVISGNKWFKLKCYLQDAIKGFKKVIVTFGGAYSNHIIATAAACNQYNLKSIGIIRGERLPELSHTLQAATAFGMELYFVSRKDYKTKTLPPKLFANYDKDDVYLINEGGYGQKGAAGAASIIDGAAAENYTHIMASVGTGTTLAGLIQAAIESTIVIGISALKNNLSLEGEITALLPNPQHQPFTLLHQYHFGGYAKYTKELIHFMNEWYTATGIPSDFVYTGKLFYAFQQLCLQGYFSENSNVLLIHSGGLQGNLSLPKETLIF